MGVRVRVGLGGQRKWAVYHSATRSETQPFELVLTVMDNFPVGFTQASCCEGAAPNNSNKKPVNKQHDWNKVDMEEEEECRAALVLSSKEATLDILAENTASPLLLPGFRTLR